ncbi:hypothetical protein [Streptomyces flavalbus]|uniref:Uncharacterized protein n=1 Tax=Streptomyces flavalbus TaxID=2665155 RepID=A0ABW2WIP2_9ACTN
MRRTSSRPLTKVMMAAAVGVTAAVGLAAPASAAEAPQAERVT